MSIYTQQINNMMEQMSPTEQKFAFEIIQKIVNILSNTEITSDNLFIALKEALCEAREQAIIHGISEMSLDEINDLIAEYRQSKRGE